MESIAFFFALVFPGALVAFNDTSLKLLPGVAYLRIYCAGIWHNAAFCGVCTLALFFVPFFSNPLYTHSEISMVLDVHSMLYFLWMSFVFILMKNGSRKNMF